MNGYSGPGGASAAPDISDEEIAFQLQLEALSESPHHYSGPDSQPSSSGSLRVVRRFGARNPRHHDPDRASAVVQRILTDKVATRRRHRLGASTPPLALNNALNVDRDGALSSDGASGSSKQRYWFDEIFGVPNGNTGFKVGREPTLQVECGICTETRPHTSFISTPGCAHEYCSECCKRHAEVKVSSGSSQIQCPHDGCLHTFDITQCRELLSHSNFDVLTTRQTEAAIPSSQKVYCPFQDCSAFMEKPANSSTRGSQFVECGTCHRGFCLKCNTPWHANKTCAEHRAHGKNASESGDEKLLDLARKEKWQVCSECQRVISLKDGCYHMTCLCGNEFCYSCGAKWKNKVASCKCKLWDESNIIRPRPGRRLQGRAHANLPANPLPNVNPFANANPFANGIVNPNVNPFPYANPFANHGVYLFANGNVNPFANPNPNVNPFARPRWI